jgi:hypothetical protein
MEAIRSVFTKAWLLAGLDTSSSDQSSTSQLKSSQARGCYCVMIGEATHYLFFFTRLLNASITSIAS